MKRETLNKIIRNRKTIYPTQFSDKEIPESVINEILENAIHAPTHRMTQPWFFKIYKGKSKDVLCEIIQKIDKEKYSAVKINKFIDKVKSSDTIISVCMTKDESNRVPEWEEIAAVLWQFKICGYHVTCITLVHIGALQHLKKNMLNTQTLIIIRNHLDSSLWEALIIMRFLN